MKPRVWNVYIIEGIDKKLYTGITNNIDRRLAAHNSGRGGKFTRSRVPFELRYTEIVPSKSDALKREAAIKKLERSEKLELIRSSE